MIDPMHRTVACLLLFAAITIGCRESDAPAPPCCSEAAATAPLPDTSIYQLTHDFDDQTGAVRKLADFRGRPIVVAMIFTHCRFACPAIVSDIQRLLAKAPGRDDVHVVLASMDSKRDTPAALAAFAKLHSLPAERFTLLHGAAFAVQELAAVLGVRYAEVEGGDFSHSNLLTLLDHDGAVQARLEGLSVDPQPLVDAIAALPIR
jgi:protein SCO1/2